MSEQEIVIVAACSHDNVIGNHGDMPWRGQPELKEFNRKDMQHFKELTIPHSVLMGRKTWESIPVRFRPLLDRTNFVITKQSNYQVPEGVIVCSSLEQAIARARDLSEKIYIAGGAQIYQQAMPVADVLEITHLQEFFSGDVFFPKIDEAVWHRVVYDQHVGFNFSRYTRIEK